MHNAVNPVSGGDHLEHGSLGQFLCNGFVSLLYSAFLLFFLTGCSESIDEPEASPVSVSVLHLETSSVRPSREFIARTAPSSKTSISARLQAEIKSIHFEEGSRVEQGQLLVRLEDTNVIADLRQAEAELTAARAEQQSASRNLQRGEEVATRGFLSAADLDKLKDRYSAAQGRLQSAEAALQRAANNLAYTEIRAPFDGWIGKLNFDVGSVVAPASGAIADIMVIDPIYVEFQLDEAEFVALRRTGQEAAETVARHLTLSLILPDGNRHSQGGALDFADISIDASTGTVAMRAVFPNSAAVLVPGLFVTLHIEGQTSEASILVPQMAVQQTIEGQFVLLVNEEQKVVQRFIQTGQRQGAMLVVESGIEAGESVIVEGMQKVRSGATVNPVPKRIDPDTGALVNPGEPTP
ncbi:MAG: efflux RND transporter periplasmic adaptor subunit [Halomonas sp.]|uniref:efflux RND transporter periplasmic adaptor subunit n=1 Tax=Halomonas sp. TaxID=1486246 RepID=UPI0039705B29